MSEDERSSSGPSLVHRSLEAHEEFIQHVESGQRRLRNLSLITLIVAFLLAAAHFSQILEPLVSSRR